MARKSKKSTSLAKAGTMGKSQSTKRVVHVSAMNEGQKEALRTIASKQITLVSGVPGTGKAQPLDSVVYSPSGPKKMGQIQIGDKVCTPDGGSARVIGIFPQGKKPVYEITFKDGSVVKASEDHLWLVMDRGCRDKGKKHLVDTSFIAMNFFSEKLGRRLSIAAIEPILFDNVDLLVDPYMLGLLIGDGSMTAANLELSTEDSEILEYVSASIDDSYSWKKGSDSRCNYRLTKKHRSNSSNIYKDQLKLLGLWGCNSEGKFIPEDYKYCSVDQRYALLQGLMDSDGWVDKRTGTAYFTSVSLRLAEDVKDIVDSLGGMARISSKETSYNYDGEKRKGQIAYNVTVSLKDNSQAFRLTRKKALCKEKTKYFPKRIIQDVRKIEDAECQCILIDHKEHMYITDGFVQTHNTHLAVGWALQEFVNGRFERIILTRPVVEAGESLGFLPGDAEQKIAPYMMPMNEILGQYFSQEDIRKMIDDKKIIILPIAYMRGCAQPLDEPVATPDGWKNMGDIKPGDLVIGSNGLPTKVSEVFFHANKQVYKVEFTDGSWTRCCDEHLWHTINLSEKRHNKPGSVRSTSELMKSLKTRFGQKNHEIPIVSEPVQFSDKIAPSIDPYVLGVLLGDGSLHEKASISFTSADTQIVDEVSKRIPSDICIKYATELTYRIVKSSLHKGKQNSFRLLLDSYGLIGAKSQSKFIPDDYKFGTVETRLEILRGLMDTDGWICFHKSGKARVQYCSTSEQLANDVIQIVESLGGTASKRLRHFEKRTASRTGDGHVWRSTGEESTIWVVDIVSPGFNPFRLSRKADRFAEFGPTRVKRLISNITYIGKMDCQCILVEAEDHLYLTRNNIVTHNTFKNACVIADECQNMTSKQIHLLLTRLGSGSKIILTGDVQQSDLGPRREQYNGLKDAIERLGNMEEIGMVNLGYEWCVREALVNKIDAAYRNEEDDNLDDPPASFDALLESGALDDLDEDWEECDCDDPDCDCEEYDED